MTTELRRRLVVIFLKWVYFFLPGLMALSVPLVFLVTLFDFPPHRGHLNLPGFKWPFWYVYAFCVLQGLLGILVWSISSLFFLLRRVWARSILEMATWVWLGWTIGFALFWVVSCAFVWKGSPFSQYTHPPEESASLAVTAGSLGSLSFAGLLAIAIKLLRGPTVSEALPGNHRQQIPLRVAVPVLVCLTALVVWPTGRGVRVLPSDPVQRAYAEIFERPPPQGLSDLRVAGGELRTDEITVWMRAHVTDSAVREFIRGMRRITQEEYQRFDTWVRVNLDDLSDLDPDAVSIGWPDVLDARAPEYYGYEEEGYYHWYAFVVLDRQRGLVFVQACWLYK